MNHSLAKTLVGLGLWLGLLSGAQAQQTQQCVANAAAGGTANVITIPSLPCGLSTNLLLLTASAINTVSGVTLQPLGSPTLTIFRADGTALLPGDLAGAGFVAELTSTGSKWLLLNPATGGSVASAASFHATEAITGPLAQGAFSYGTLPYTDTNIFASWQTSVNSYAQHILSNTNGGTTASADYVVSNDLGTATTYYGDFGINSSGFVGTGSLNLPSAVFLTATSGDLAIGTTTGNAIHLAANGASTDAITVSTGNVPQFPTTPQFNTLTGYIKGAGTSNATAATTVPSVDFADGNTGTGAVAHAVSPSFTTPSLGVATGTTPGNNDNSTKVATTAYVQNVASCINILTKGGAGDGSTDNNAALTAAEAALPGTGGCIYFPPAASTYNFAASHTFTLPAGQFSVTYLGAGADVSRLNWPAGGGLTVAASSAQHSVHVADLSLLTGAANTGSALTLSNTVLLGNYAQSDVTRVTIRGVDGFAATDSWVHGIAVVGLSNINFDTVLVYGNSGGVQGDGINLIGVPGTSPFYGVVYNIAKSSFYKVNIGLSYGSYIQGVTVTQSNFVNGSTGIYVPPSGTGATELAVSDSNFNTTSNQVLISSPIAAVMFSHNLVYVGASTTGFWFNSTGGQSTFVGNAFSGVSVTGSTGIYASSAQSPVTVVGNTFNGLGTAINLQGSTSGWNVCGNQFAGNTTNIGFAGGNNICPTGMSVSAAVPTVSSGFGTSPSVTASNGTATFRVNVGTGGSASTGVIAMNATAPNGWNCTADDITTITTSVYRTKMTASTTTTVTLANYGNGAASSAWTASDILQVSCLAY